MRKSRAHVLTRFGGCRRQADGVRRCPLFAATNAAAAIQAPMQRPQYPPEHNAKRSAALATAAGHGQAADGLGSAPCQLGDGVGNGFRVPRIWAPHQGTSSGKGTGRLQSGAQASRLQAGIGSYWGGRLAEDEGAGHGQGMDSYELQCSGGR